MASSFSGRMVSERWPWSRSTFREASAVSDISYTGGSSTALRDALGAPSRGSRWQSDSGDRDERSARSACLDFDQAGQCRAMPRASMTRLRCSSGRWEQVRDLFSPVKDRSLRQVAATGRRERSPRQVAARGRRLISRSQAAMPFEPPSGASPLPRCEPGLRETDFFSSLPAQRVG